MNNNNKGHKIRFNRVDVQVFLMTAVIVVFACGLIFLVNYSLSYGSMNGLKTYINTWKIIWM